MALFTIIKLSSYIYFLTSLLLPDEMINLTAQFMSYIIIPMPVDSSTVIPHVLKSILLLVRFVVLFTILGGNAIYALVKKEGNREKKPSITRNKPTPTIQQNDNIKVKEEPQPLAAAKIEKKETATNNTPMHSSADSMLQSTTTTTSETKTESTAALPIINNDVTVEPANTTIPTINHQLENNDKNEPISAISNDEKITTTSQLEDNNESTQKVNNNDDIITTIREEKPSVVEPILVHDQLTKDNNIPTTTPAIKHVIPSTNTTAEKDITMEKETVQPEKITEATIPHPKSEDQQDEEEHHSITTTSTTITPPAEPSSDDSKEQYYSEIIKKDSNIMSLSDNLQRIFDEPPSTPIPQLDTNLIDNVTQPNDGTIINHDIKRHSTIEEMMSTPTPALTPPQANSTSSRRSSTTSSKSNSPAFKSRFQTAMQKVSAKSGPRPSLPQQPEQQQQILGPTIIDTSNSSSLLKDDKKSRFSSLRLTRKKSTFSILSNLQPQPQQQLQNQLEQPALEVKSSVSSKLQNKFKKSGKRLSRIFS